MMKNIFLAVVTAVLLLVFPSCASQINGSFTGEGQADLGINAELKPGVSALIGRFAALSGTAKPGAPLLDGPSLAASMSRAPGIASVSFTNKTPSSIQGPVKISRISDFLSSGRASGFISFEQKNSAGEGYCAVNLNLATGPQILGLVSPEVSMYLNALMSPLATGERMTKDEYLVLVASVYGKSIADEISSSSIRASVNFPGVIQRVKGGTYSGKRADFEIPLLDILVLETPLNYEVVWK
ncbi:MAG: hypothetical protein LBC52_02075 [Treponema sp.]|jgi:hypothetical protein|nr:hypothetical protein [Treponema sp.]